MTQTPAKNREGQFEGNCAGCNSYPIMLREIRMDVYRCDECAVKEARGIRTPPTKESE